jgi:hypothetical protein
MKPTLAILAVAIAFVTSARADGTKLTKADLTDATNIVYASYGKDKYDAVVKKVVGRLGPAQTQKASMVSWFAKDGDKCVQFWVTTADKGFAATGMSSDTEDAKNGCK